MLRVVAAAAGAAPLVKAATICKHIKANWLGIETEGHAAAQSA